MEEELTQVPQAPAQPQAEPQPVRQPADPRYLEMDKLTRRYRHGRASLGILLLLSAFNMVLLAMDRMSYWPYAVSAPYQATMFMKALENDFIDGPWVNGPITVTFLVLSAVILCVYLACWICSKKHGTWLLVSAILYSVDSVLLLLFVLLVMEDPLSYLMDFLFHILALVELYMGGLGQQKLLALQRVLQPAPVQSVPQYRNSCDPEKF